VREIRLQAEPEIKTGEERVEVAKELEPRCRGYFETKPVELRRIDEKTADWKRDSAETDPISADSDEKHLAEAQVSGEMI
jgi:hypothetical protein